MYLKKFISQNCYRILQTYVPRNLIIDRLVKPIPFDQLSILQNVSISCLNIHSNNYEKWVKQFFPTWYDKFRHIRHKKLIEFYSTFILLNPRPRDIFMDATGGGDTYLKDIECKRRILQDIKVSADVKSCLGITSRKISFFMELKL